MELEVKPKVENLSLQISQDWEELSGVHFTGCEEVAEETPVGVDGDDDGNNVSQCVYIVAIGDGRDRDSDREENDRIVELGWRFEKL